MYKLLQIVDDNVVAEFVLEEGVFGIGRNTGNNVQPDDESVSGNHARITLAASAYLDDALDAVIEDLNSTNGTYINGRSVQRQLLKHGDILAVGTQGFKFIDTQALAMGGTRILLQEEN
jgi:pSer/pThr/pTyr-binding forkhead associated (FHA) protein